MTPQQARQLQAAAKFLAAALRGDEAGALLLVEEHRDHTDPRAALLARLVQEALVRLSHPTGLQRDTPAAAAPAELDPSRGGEQRLGGSTGVSYAGNYASIAAGPHQTPGEVFGHARESARPVEAVKRGMTAVGGQDERQAPPSGPLTLRASAHLTVGPPFEG